MHLDVAESAADMFKTHIQGATHEWKCKIDPVRLRQPTRKRMHLEGRLRGIKLDNCFHMVRVVHGLQHGVDLTTNLAGSLDQTKNRKVSQFAQANGKLSNAMS
jgi:hypothetical protein